MHLKQRRAPLRFRIVEPLALRHGNAIALSQKFQRFRKRQAFMLHDKLENVAAGIAAEALVELKRAVNAE